MFRSKLRTFLTLGVSIFLFLFLMFCALFIYHVPGHPINIALFKFGYSITPSQKTFLEYYSPQRRDVANGDIPPEVDEFLCRRIEETSDEKEISAIINFYAVQAGGREGNCIYRVSESTQQKITAQIIQEFDTNRNLSGKLILLEQIRRGKSLGKGQIFIKNLRMPDELPIEEWGNWQNENVAARAKTHFLKWWDLDLDWRAKKEINPLLNSEVKIVECCG